MSSKSTAIRQDIEHYISDYYNDINDPIIKRLLAESKENNVPDIHISIEQAAFIQWLIKNFNFKRILEIGTLTGYSALIMAKVIDKGGTISTIEKNKRFIKIAKKYWSMANVTDIINIYEGIAKPIIENLIKNNEHFDFILIDADKENYDYYYEKSLTLISTNGIIAIDNMFAFGRINEKDFSTKEVDIIRRLNKKIKNDHRISNLLLPLGDGLTLIKKQGI